MGQMNQTGRYDEEIDVKALQEMYKMFVVECPSGVLFLHEFKRFFGVDPTGEASDYAEAMFRAFDRNGVRRCLQPQPLYKEPWWSKLRICVLILFSFI